MKKMQDNLPSRVRKVFGTDIEEIAFFNAKYKAYSEGQKAFFEKTECTYKEGTREWDYWQTGYSETAFFSSKSAW